METTGWLAVTHNQALRFFFERLKDVTDDAEPSTDELLYNASVLAHFATTSTRSTPTFPSTPADLTMMFDLFVLDRSQHADPEIMEAAASQCLLLTGFFADQMKRRHNITWFASLGAGFYDSAAQHNSDRTRARMMITMAARFEFWRRQQQRLAKELHDINLLIPRRPVDPWTSPG
jgi:hypothetical protein